MKRCEKGTFIIWFFCFVGLFLEASCCNRDQENIFSKDAATVTVMPKDWYQHLYQLMKDVHELFTIHKLEYWIQGGTLLGAVRHKGIIPWDDDIDINIKKDDEGLFVSLIPSLEQLSYAVIPVWFGYKIVSLDVFDLGDLKGSPCIDIFFTVETDEKVFYDQHWMIRDEGPIFITKQELYPLKVYTLGDVFVLGPRDPVPYLNASFSKDWPHYARIWNHFFKIEEERILRPEDLYAAPCGRLEDRVFPDKKESVRVYASMVADLFHYGHVEFLKKARSLGTTLIVGLISDAVAKDYKREPILQEQERTRVVSGCKYVDEVICGAPLAVTRDFVVEHKIDYVVHGDDFQNNQLSVYFKDPVAMNMMRLIPYTQGISTSMIIERIKKSLLS